MMNPRERILCAMAGGKPDRVPVFISAYWDHWVRAAGGDPFEYAYGDMNHRLQTELAVIRRYTGTAIHRTSPGFSRSVHGRLAEEHVHAGLKCRARNH